MDLPAFMDGTMDMTRDKSIVRTTMRKISAEGCLNISKAKMGDKNPM